MIAVFVTDDHRAEVFQVDIDFAQPPAQFAATDTGVEQHLDLAGRDKSRVAGASASDGANA
jgi:hypothetical protein